MASEIATATDADLAQAAKAALAELAGDGVNQELVARLAKAQGNSLAVLIELVGQRRIDGYKDDATGLMVAGYRALGVRVDVLAMGEKKVPFAGYVGMLPNLSLTNEVRAALENSYRRVVSAVPSGDVLYVEKIVQAMLAVPGVRKVIPFNTENILCDVNEVLIPDIFDIDPIPNP